MSENIENVSLEELQVWYWYYLDWMAQGGIVREDDRLRRFRAAADALHISDDQKVRDLAICRRAFYLDMEKLLGGQ